MSPTSMVFVGIAGSVIALERTTGIEVWRARLKSSDFVNVAFMDGELYASTAGELFCLHPATGAIRWQNPLKGFGRGLMSIAVSGSQQAVVMGEKKQRDDAAASAATIST